MARIRVVGRRSAEERCAICHGALRGEATVCEGCGSATHLDCRRELGRCPTLGCRASAKASAAGGRPMVGRHPSPGLLARIGPYSRLAVSGAASAALLLGSLVALLAPLGVSWRTFRAAVGTGNPVGFLAVAALYLGVVVVVGFLSARWLRRIPSVFREVRQLLDETEPVPMRLHVRHHDVGENSREYFAELINDQTSITLELKGLLPPWWLHAAAPGTPVFVYGLPPPGPYLIEMPNGLLALVHPD